MNASTQYKQPDPARTGWIPRRPLTVVDLDLIPDGDGHRYELQDGMLQISPIPPAWHQHVAFQLPTAMERLVPDLYEPRTHIGFSTDPHNYREPDFAICSAGAVQQETRSDFPSQNEILLVGEVSSTTSRRLDTYIKPAEYAAAGIPFYLRVDLEDRSRGMNLFLYRRVPRAATNEDGRTSEYQLEAQAISGRGPLVLPEPFCGVLDPDSL